MFCNYMKEWVLTYCVVIISQDISVKSLCTILYIELYVNYILVKRKKRIGIVSCPSSITFGQFGHMYRPCVSS